MAVVGDVLRLTDFQSIEGQQILNVYFYQCADLASTNADLDAMLEAFDTQIITQLLPFQHSTLSHDSLSLFNITNNMDIATLALGTAGTASGNGLATSQLCYAIRFNRPNANIRNGQKRIAGITEGNIVINSLAEGVQAALQVVADDMASPLIVDLGGGNEDIYVPVLVGRNTDGSYDLTRVYQFTSATVPNRISTQNSRKPYQ